MKTIRLRFLYFIISLVILGYCSKDDLVDNGYLDEPLCLNSFFPKSFDYEVIGFYPYYRQNTLPDSEIRCDKITRIIYAFLKPNADGILNTSDFTVIAQLVEEAHANGVEVYVSVRGGGSNSDNFPAIAADEDASARLGQEIRQYLFANCLDGVDIDWEQWTGSTTNTVIQEESLV